MKFWVFTFCIAQCSTVFFFKLLKQYIFSATITTFIHVKFVDDLRVYYPLIRSNNRNKHLNKLYFETNAGHCTPAYIMKYIEPFQVQIKPPVHKNASYKCITCIYDYKGLIKIIFIQRRSSANSTKQIKMVERNVIQILGLPRNKIHINHNIMKAFNLTEPKLKIDNNFYLI